MSAAASPNAVPSTINLVTKAVERISAESLRLAQSVEQLVPGTNMGIWRHQHMQDAAQHSEALSSALGLDAVEAMLLKLILVSHDLGRFVEFKERYHNPGAPTLNHGRYSGMILTQLNTQGVFSGIPEQCIADMINAVIWHGERVVNLPSGSRAHKLCYLLRDQDKLEILSQDAFGQYEMSFCYKELVSALRVFSLAAVTQLERRRGEIEAFLHRYFSGEQIDVTQLTQDPELHTVYNACSRKLSREDEGVVAVLEKRSALNTKCYGSFSEFFLLHVAMVFDLQHKHSFDVMKDQRMLEVKWRFIERHADAALYAELRSSFDAFVADKSK